MFDQVFSYKSEDANAEIINFKVALAMTVNKCKNKTVSVKWTVAKLFHPELNFDLVWQLCIKLNTKEHLFPVTLGV